MKGNHAISLVVCLILVFCCTLSLTKTLMVNLFYASILTLIFIVLSVALDIRVRPMKNTFAIKTTIYGLLGIGLALTLLFVSSLLTQ